MTAAQTISNFDIDFGSIEEFEIKNRSIELSAEIIAKINYFDGEIEASLKIIEEFKKKTNFVNEIGSMKIEIKTDDIEAIKNVVLDNQRFIEVVKKYRSDKEQHRILMIELETISATHNVFIDTASEEEELPVLEDTPLEEEDVIPEPPADVPDKKDLTYTTDTGKNAIIVSLPEDYTHVVPVVPPKIPRTSKVVKNNEVLLPKKCKGCEETDLNNFKKPSNILCIACNEKKSGLKAKTPSP
jgi:hypothetical protein